MGVCSNRDGCFSGKDITCGKGLKRQHTPSDCVVRELENIQGSCQERGVTRGGIWLDSERRGNTKRQSSEEFDVS